MAKNTFKILRCFTPQDFQSRFCHFFNIINESVDPFYSTGLFLYPLETLGKQRLSDVFRRYTGQWNETG